MLWAIRKTVAANYQDIFQLLVHLILFPFSRLWPLIQPGEVQLFRTGHEKLLREDQPPRLGPGWLEKGCIWLWGYPSG